MMVALGSCRGVAEPTTNDPSFIEPAATSRRIPKCPEKRIAVVKQALGAILTCEQVQFQRNGTGYVDASDIAELRALFGIELGSLGSTWRFSVRDASASGFVAEARGRPRTRVSHVVVTLAYERGAPFGWSVQGCRERRPGRNR